MTYGLAGRERRGLVRTGSAWQVGTGPAWSVRLGMARYGKHGTVRLGWVRSSRYF